MKFETDVYPVGLLKDVQYHRLRYGLRHYVWGYCIKGRRWRALRNYFNGYLAEHRGCAHNAGRGWTKKAALRRVRTLCAGAVQ